MASDIEVGKKIRALRKIRGISLQQMANDTGMSYSYLSGLENGKHSVSITNLQRVATFFDVDMEKNVIVMHGKEIKVQQPNCIIFHKL